MTTVRLSGVYDSSSDDGKVIGATGSHLKAYRKPVTSGGDHGSDSTYTSEDDSSPSNDGSISEEYRSKPDDHISQNGKIIIWC